MATAASAQITNTASGNNSRQALPWVARRTTTIAITRNNAASAPATGAGSTSGVEISPFMNALSLIDISFRLLDLGYRDFYHIRPFFDVLEQEGFKFLGRLHQGNRSLLKPDFLYFRFVNDLVDVGVEEADDFFRRSLRGHDTKPDCRFIASNRVSDCRQVWREFRASQTGGTKCPYLSCLRQLQHGRYSVEHHLYRARN